MDLSLKIQIKDVFLVENVPVGEPDFSLPAADGTAYFTFTDERTVRTRPKDGEGIRRVYTKKESRTGMRYGIRIYVGDYAVIQSGD